MAEAKLDLNDSGWRKLIVKMSSSPRLLRFFKIVATTMGWKDVREHFTKAEGESEPWPERSESTERQYLEIFKGKRKPPEGYQRGMYRPGKALLVLSGQLSKSFKFSNVRDLSSGVTLYNPIEYAGQHDSGDPSVGLPRRQFMWLSKKAQDLILQETLKRSLEEG